LKIEPNEAFDEFEIFDERGRLGWDSMLAYQQTHGVPTQVNRQTLKAFLNRTLIVKKRYFSGKKNF
jgi:hypothetical protein